MQKKSGMNHRREETKMKSIKEVFVIREADWQAPDMSKNRPPGVPNSGTGKKFPPPLDELTPEEMEQVKEWFYDESGFDTLPPDLEIKLVDLFRDEMPIDVQQGNTGTPDEWLFKKIDELLPNVDSWRGK